MKQNYLIKTLMLLVAFVGGVSFSWAIDIPQDLGSYIPIGTVPTSGSKTTAAGVTLTGCSVDGSAKAEEYISYTVGSANGSTMKIEFALTAEDGDYLLSFKTGAQDASTVSLSLTNSSNQVVWSKTNESIEDTDSWSLTKSHNFVIGNLTAGNYTMTITGVSKTGSYYGNFGNFCFHKSTQYANNWNNTSDVNFADAYLSGLTLDGTYLTKIDEGDYVEYYSYVPNIACYNLYCGIGYSTAGTDNFTITITDVATNTAEVDAVNYTVVSSHLYQMTSKINEGWKKIRLAFPTQPESGSCRVEHVKYNAFAQLPLMGAGGVNTYLVLNSGTFGRTASAKYNHDPAYESNNDNIGYNGDGGYAEFYVGNTNETAYYDFHIGTSRYQEATFTLTITDVATSTVEVNQSGLVVPSGSSYADQTYKLTNAITPGLKKVRIETASESDSYAFNYKNVTFYKRSLNEAYDYTPVAATDVDMVLTRSLPADKWATIVLPFALTSEQITSAFGANVKVAQLTGFSNDIMQFTSVTETNANEPYLIKRKDGEYNSGTATFNGVTIVEGTPQKTSINGINFIGSYDALTNIPYSDASYAYYFISSNTFYQTEVSGTPDTMKGTRAYFKVPGTTAARSLSFSVDGGETTSIVNLNVNDNANFDNNAPIFNLAGQRVGKNYKGIVIVNGKKMINK